MFSIPFTVEKSTTVNKSLADVFASVSDFKTWREWSPWLCQEPSCPVTVEGTAGEVGHSQAWDGDFIGSGKMVLAAATPNESLDYELTFLKPWKTHSKVGFRFRSAGDQTEVTWWMRGTLPFFMFFMKKMMSAWVGADYVRGLGMLKELLDSGTVQTRTDVQGVVDRNGLHYAGKRRSCSLAEVGPAMEKDLADLAKMVEGSKLPTPKDVFSIYHQYDPVKGKCEYTSGFLYESKPDAVSGLETGTLPNHKALRVDHLGPYRHLGNAWSAAMGCVRSKHKRNKSVPMYEVYGNNPHEVPEDELKVEIFVPVKE